MSDKRPRGLFITGTDTHVGKTHVTAMIARALVATGLRVGVYKPVASGCGNSSSGFDNTDAELLWQAAGKPATLEQVCPQCFAAPLAPHLAARAEGREVDQELLRSGLQPWLAASDVVLVEGVGGLLSPINDDEYVADLALDFGFPLVVVVRDALGTIHQTLATLIAAATFRDGLDVAGIVLNELPSAERDDSISTNRAELEARAVPPVLAKARPNDEVFHPPVNWYALAKAGKIP